METNISLLNNIFLKLYLILGIIAISSCVHPTQIVAVDTMMAKVVGDVNIQYTSTKTSISYSSVDTIFVWGLYKYNDTTYTTYLNLPKVIQPGNYQIGSIVKNVLIECTFSKTFPTAGGDDYKSYYLNQTGSITITQNDDNAIAGIFNASMKSSDNKIVTLTNGNFYCKKK